jgi:23S rRNA pseudouridine1911/1915/1917 synthase
LKRWVVLAGSFRTVDEVVSAMGEDVSAIDDGRVFVGRSRAKRGQEVSPGNAVSVHARSSGPDAVTILYNERGIVAVDKPVGIPTIADHAGRSLASLVAGQLGVTPHPTSRLDRDVSGVVVFATTDRAREHLASARGAGKYERLYVALTQAVALAPEGTWDSPIGRGRDPRLRTPFGKDAVAATTRYRVVAVAPGGSLLAVTPITGRTHQIRVHASHAGAPLVGDRAYGGAVRLVSGTGAVIEVSRIALHCARVKIPKVGVIEAPVPDDLRAVWRALGGKDDWVIVPTPCPSTAPST